MSTRSGKRERERKWVSEKRLTSLHSTPEDFSFPNGETWRPSSCWVSQLRWVHQTCWSYIQKFFPSPLSSPSPGSFRNRVRKTARKSSPTYTACSKQTSCPVDRCLGKKVAQQTHKALDLFTFKAEEEEEKEWEKVSSEYLMLRK